MGLDNGITLVTKKSKSDIELLKEEYDWLDIDVNDWRSEDFKDITVDICYWRKCWNIRSMIFNIIKPEADNDTRTELHIDDINKIIDGLVNFLKNPIAWDLTQPIWTYSEIRLNLVTSITNLSWLKTWLEANPKDYAYFYDSY